MPRDPKQRAYVTCERWVGDETGTRLRDSSKPLPPDFDNSGGKQPCWAYYVACHLYGLSVEKQQLGPSLYRLVAETGPRAWLSKPIKGAEGEYEWIEFAIRHRGGGLRCRP